MSRDTSAAPGVASTQSGHGQSTAGANARPQYSTTPSEAQRPSHGRIVGNVWSKTVRRSAHMLRSPVGWAVDAEDLRRAEALGAQWVELKEQERGAIYRATVAMFRRKGLAFDRGCGFQIALPLGYWSTSDGEPQAEQEQEPLQLSLFGAVRP